MNEILALPIFLQLNSTNIMNTYTSHKSNVLKDRTKSKTLTHLYHRTSLLNLGPQLPQLQNKGTKDNLPAPKILTVYYPNCDISIHLKISNVKIKPALLKSPKG